MASGRRQPGDRGNGDRNSSDRRSEEPRPGDDDTIVLVHGLWMIGYEFGVLRNRLVHDGFRVEIFSYSSMHGDVASIGAELRRRVDADPGERVHLVGHSLGGAFVYRALMNDGAPLEGRAVLLGSPLNGSRAVRAVMRWPWLAPMLGAHVASELVSPCGRAWDGRTALGAIAGTRPIGTGRFFARFDEDNDGTVGLSETIIPGLTDHLVVPHSHIGMLFAQDVADQVAHFLRVGRFNRPER
jgi:pimeloyl-ACP methyl ester carboxylesterase